MFLRMLSTMYRETQNVLQWQSTRKYIALNLARSWAVEGQYTGLWRNSSKTTPMSYSQTPARVDEKSVKLKLLRKLGKLEKFLFEHGERYGWYRIINCLHIRSKFVITSEQIAEAMRRLQQRHACLRMSVVEEDGVKYFAEVPDAVDLKLLQTSDVKSAVETLEGERCRKGELLWKVMMLQPEKEGPDKFIYPFIFAYQHSVLDGITVTTGIYPTLLDYLDSYAANSSDFNWEIESLPLLPAREQLYMDIEMEKTEFQAAATDALTDMTDLSLRRFATALAQMYKPDSPRPVSGLEHFVVNAAVTTSITKAAKQHHVTVNSVCVSAIAIGTFKFLTKIGVLKTDTLTFEAPFVVDLRRFADPPFPPQHAGAYHSDCLHRVTLTSEQVDANSSAPFWKIAHSIDSELKESIESRQPISVAIENDAWIDSLEEDDPIGTEPNLVVGDFVTISNLGNLKWLTERKEGTNVDVEKFICVNGGREPDLFGFHIMTLNEKIQFELSYSKMLVPDELAEMYISLVKEQLMKVSSS